MIWAVLAAMTGAAVLAVLWPLSRPSDHPEELAAAGGPDALFYRDQIAEIARDEARGLIAPREAEAARAEAARRLLRAAAGRRPAHEAVGEPALRRRRAVSTLALSAIPLIALAVYGALGSPTLPSQSLAERQAADPGRLDMNAALVRIEAHLAANPNDGRGWEVVAPVYLRLGRADEAARAYRAALRHLGETAPRLSALGEALVAAGDGVVSAEARAAFEAAVQQDANLPKARYYLALAAEQDGRADEARNLYQALLASSPPDAPWLGAIRERLAGLAGSPASLGPDQQAAIQGMVEGLAGRLAASGGSAQEWGRLVRSYVVLGQRDKAVAALKRGEAALAQDLEGREALRAAARAAGLTAGAAP